MKLSPFKPSNGTSRKPQRTLEEMASEFGVSPFVLAGYLSKSEFLPPKGERKGRRPNTSLWFDQDEIRNWWARRWPNGFVSQSPVVQKVDKPLTRKKTAPFLE